MQDLKRAPPVPLVPAQVTRRRVRKVTPLSFQSLFFSGMAGNGYVYDIVGPKKGSFYYHQNVGGDTSKTLSSPKG